MKKRIGIVSMGSISALGCQIDEVWANYLSPSTCLQKREEDGQWVGQLPLQAEQRIAALRAEGKPFHRLDRSVLLAIESATQATAPLEKDDALRWGINIGSSRGATQIMEQAHEQFLNRKGLSPNTSPLTTLGNVSTWVAQRLGVQAMGISHSVTCSTALQSIANGVAWLEAERCDRFLAGGTEAPLTPFTLAQMKALRIYAKPAVESYPCRAMDLSKEENSLVLGEAAASFVLASTPVQKPLAWIIGMGYAMEPLSSPTSISATGTGLQQAMRMALAEAGLRQVDVIVSHTPGTIRGDQAEFHAIGQVFSETLPAITNNKWKIGHTFGASGALSLELALLMLQRQVFVPLPFSGAPVAKKLFPINTVMINATGFGSNTISLIVAQPDND